MRLSGFSILLAPMTWPIEMGASLKGYYLYEDYLLLQWKRSARDRDD